MYNLKRTKYEMVYAEFTFERMVMIFVMEYIIFALFVMQFDYYNIKRVHDQGKGLPLFIYL